MSGGATAYRPRDTLPHQTKEERLTSYGYSRTQDRKYSNSLSPNVSSRALRISTASPSFSAHPPLLSVVDHSNRSSSTYLNHTSHSSSNRSSTNTNSGDYPMPSRRSGRGTPSSEISHYSKRSGPISKIHDEATLSPKQKSKGKAISVVETVNKEIPKDPPKKKGFSIFSLFRRSKKKDPSLTDVSIIEGAMNDLIIKVKSPAEIRAEELRSLHEEEFSKLRRQREKDKNRSIYDMLPQSRQIKSEPASRNISSPSSNFSASPSTGFISPLATPRIRSSSSSNVGLPRPSTTFYPNQFNPPYSNHPASRSSTHFSPMGYPERGFGYANSTGAHRSTDSVNMQHARNLARSPLIPQQHVGRRSFYASGNESLSQQTLHPLHYNQQYIQSHSPQYYRNSRAWV